MFSEVFFTLLITSIIGFMLAISRMLYKSKCREFGCCGLKIIRDVNLEAEIDEEMIENGISPSDSSRELKINHKTKDDEDETKN